MTVPLIDRRAFEDIYAVDGGSTDGTVEYLRKAGVKVFPQGRAGYNAAYIEAFERCRTDALILFHPKGTVSPKEILKLKEALGRGFDLVVASRNIKGGSNEEDRNLFRFRKWFVSALSHSASALWRKEGYKITDVLHGFRGMRVEAFSAIHPRRDGLSIDLEMVARSYKLKLKLTEVPVVEVKREHGSTKFKAWPTGRRLLAYMWFELFRGD